MLNAHAQKGLSPLGVLFVVCVFAAALLAVFKIAPHYLDYNTLTTVYSDVAKDPAMKGASQTEIFSGVKKRLRINGVRSFSVKENSFYDDSEEVPVLGFEYVVKENLAGNLFAYMEFSHEVEIK